MPTHAFFVHPAALAKENSHPAPADWPKGPVRAGQGVLDAVTHRWHKPGPRGSVIVGRGDRPGQIILYSPRLRAVATVNSRGDGLEIQDLLPFAATPADAVVYLAVFKLAMDKGGMPADQLGIELTQLANPRRAAAPPPAPPPPPPPAPPPPPPRVLRRLTDEDLRPTAPALSPAVSARLKDVPPATRRRFLPRSDRASVDEIQAVRELKESLGLKSLTFLPEALRALFATPPADDIEIDDRVREALRVALGIPLVSQLCAQAGSTQKLHQCLSVVARFPLQELDRAVLWLAMGAGASPMARATELEQIAKDFGPAAHDAAHAELWAHVLEEWLKEALDGLPEEELEFARHLRHILDDRPASHAAFLGWRELQVHIRRRPPAVLREELPPEPRSSGRLGEIIQVLNDGVKVGNLPVTLAGTGEDTPPPASATAGPPSVGVPPAPPPPTRKDPPPPPLPGRPASLWDLSRRRLCRGVEDALAALEALREAETRWAAAPLDTARLAAVGASLDQALGALRAQQASLPAPEEVAATRQTVEEIAASLGLGLEAPLSETLADVVVAPDGLDRIRDGGLVAKRAEAVLPDWVWGALPGGPARVAVVAGDPAFHDELVACLRWAEEPSLTSPSDLRDLANSGTGPLLERLRAAHEERARTHERDKRLARIAPITSEAVRAHFAASWPETEPEIAAREKLLSSFESLTGALGAQPREDLRARLAASSVENGSTVVREVERVRARLGSVDNMPLEQILKIAQLIPETVRPPTVVVPSFSFGPPLSSSPTGGTHHARGIFQPFESLPGYGTVSLPVRLTFDQALPAPIQLKIKTTRASGEFRTPVQLMVHDEVPPLDLPAGTTQRDFEIKVVLSRTFAEEMVAGKRKNLEVVVEGTGPGGKSDKTTLTWTALALETFPYRDPIPGTIQPEEILQCPVGVESYLDALCTLVRQGQSSFLVYGPRRFGKTSLLRAVQHLMDAKDVVFLQPIGAGARPLPELWGDVAQRLQDRFRPAKVYGDLEGGILPVEYAYDAIREEAAEQGVRAIYVVIDEAQAMFAHARREELAERLKERMENAWMAQNRNGKKRAAILFGFIGQAHLRRLLSRNLEASLKPYHRSEFTDEEVLGLLRRTTGAGGLQSSREAREHMAKLAGNLFILNRLLSEIHAVCTEGRRTWFLRADVDRASDKLAEDFRKGSGTTIWDWVRDPLNESDNLNTWRPSTAYPLALAWAGARARGERGRAGALALLKRMCPEAEPLDERVSEVLHELEDLGVLDDHGDFKLPMLERLLAIRSQSPRPLDDAEREAAQRLGLLRVPRPKPETNDGEAVTQHEGGQAKVWRGKWDGRTAAVRAISLSDKTRSRARFIHEVSLLRKIGSASEQRLKVRLPHIFAMGIAEDDPSTGLVIYEWIPGYPLPEESMTEAAVVEVGLQMADVLELLERIGIVHRDIRPANVLLRVPPEGQDARVEIDIVLIDFGLARSVELLRGGQHSIVEGVAAFIPPEVYGANDPAAWSTAGDLYSTGVMLEKLLQRSASVDGAASSRQLRSLIAEMKAVNPGNRPTAGHLRTSLRAVRKSQEGERKVTGLEEIEKTVRGRLARLPEPMRRSALDHLHSLVFMQAGMLPELRRYTALGAILECAFRLVVKPHLPSSAPLPTTVYLRQASDLLRQARLPAPAWLDDRRAEATGRLRNAEHHPDDFVRILSQALGQLGSSYMAPDREARLTEALDHVARLLDELTHSRDRLVATFVAEMLRAGASGQALRVR